MIVGKEKQMNTKKRKIFSMAICVIFLIVTFASLFSIAKEENHNCTGEDCPICANIHQAEQTLKNLNTGVIARAIMNPLSLILVLLIMGEALFVSSTSLISQKVRLNN